MILFMAHAVGMGAGGVVVGGIATGSLASIGVGI